MSGIKFKSGVWEGFYMVNGKKSPVVLQLNFQRANGSMNGNGKEETMGGFTVKGNFSEKAPYPVDFTWTFSGNYDVRLEFNGWRESDKGGVFGTWKGSTGSGSFAIYPSKEGSEVALKLKQESSSAIKGSLLSMGFPDFLVEQAINETDELEEAVNWCSEQMNESKLLAASTAESTDNEEVDETSLAQLVSMGFDAELAKQALIQTKGNIEAAANMLFD